MGFDSIINHQRIQTTRLHTTRCHYCNVDFVCSVMSHATLILFYQTSMLTPQNSSIIVCTLVTTKHDIMGFRVYHWLTTCETLG